MICALRCCWVQLQQRCARNLISPVDLPRLQKMVRQAAGEVTARAPCRARHRSTLVLAAFSLTAAIAVAVAVAGRLARCT